jgi:hypothetical protein
LDRIPGAGGKTFDLTMVFLISISMFGLILSMVFVASSSIPADDFAFRKIVAGSTFAAVCILGIMSGLYPTSCSGIFDLEREERNTPSYGKSHGRSFQGHHPNCGSFSSHVLRIGERKFCASCSGLVVGAVVALFGTGICFFGNVRLAVGTPLLASVGAFGVTLGLLHPTVLRLTSCARFLAGILFVAGSFLVFVSVENSARNTLIDLFFVALSVLWILTKISLSKWEHQRICSQCSLESCGAEHAIERRN